MRSSNIPLTLVGNSLAIQVASTERAARGEPTLVINTGGPWGGHFSGINLDGSLWDAGMVTFEFTSFRTPTTPASLASYDPMRRNDIGRFTQVVQNYVEKRLPTREIRPLQMWIGDRYIPDLLLGNEIEAVRQLPCSERISEELINNMPQIMPSPWLAQHKDSWPIPDIPNYNVVSQINHGNVLHDAVFAPFGQKIMGQDASRLHGLFHRIPWLPLYWQETIVAALKREKGVLKPTIYSQPIGAPISQFSSNLTREMMNSPHITVRNDRIQSVKQTSYGFQLSLEQTGTVQTTRLGWSQSPQQGLSACGINIESKVENRIPLMLIFIRYNGNVLRKEFSVIHTITPDTGFYRVNNVSESMDTNADTQTKIIVEANPDIFNHHYQLSNKKQSAERVIIQELQRLGIIASGVEPSYIHVLRLPNALPLPTSESHNAWLSEQKKLLEVLPGIELLANSAGPFATSLADQIVQGLQLVNRRVLKSLRHEQVVKLQQYE